MTEYAKPLASELAPWASSGDIDTPSPTKISTGWEAEEKPPHETMNWQMNKTDRGLLYLLQQGVPLFDPVFPYVINSICKGSSGSLFSSKGTSTGQDPELDITETYWKKLIDSSGAVAVGDISTYIWGLLDDEDADEAQTTLGGSTVGKAVFVAADEAAARSAIGGSYFTDRANHSGSQAISTVTSLQATLDAKEVTANKTTTLVGANDTTYPTSKAVADAISVAASGENYKGEWNANTNTPTLTSGVGTAGDYYRVSVAGTTNLDGVSSWALGDEAFFDGTDWLKRPNYFPSLTTDDITEGINQYFSASRVRGVVLTGISFLTSLAVTATDNVLEAFGKLQAQVTQLFARVPLSGGSTGQMLVKASGTDYDYAWQTPSSSLVVPLNDLGEKATSGSETVNLDLSVNNDWNVSLNSANTTGTLTLNLTNLPSTAGGKYVGYIRIRRGGRKTVAYTVPAGKSWNWVTGSNPQYTVVAGEYDVVMFYNMLNEAKIHAMIVDTGVV